MNKYKFNIGNQIIELDENDLIFGYMFKALYLPVYLKTLDYQTELLSIEKYNTKDIKRSLNNISKQQSLSEYERESIIDFYNNYICNISLHMICADIKEILVYAVDEIIDDFEKYNNHEITILNVSNTIKEKIKSIEREYYDYAVSIGIRSFKGVSFEECNDDQMVAYAIRVSDSYQQNAFEGNQQKDGFLAKYGALFDRVFTETELIDYLYQEGNAKEFIELVKKCENPLTPRFTMLNLRESCMVEILKIIENISKKYNLPLNLQYCQESNLIQVLEIVDRMEMEDEEKFLAGKINISEFQNICVQILQKFPFITGVYMCAMVGCGCVNGELEKMMRLVGINDARIEMCKTIVFENRFLPRIKYDINNEEEVKKAYENLQKYKKYLNYEKCDAKDQELMERLLIFDKQHRTVNGKEYATLEEANEVRERSFDGKEYDNKEEAELVRNEVESIRSAYDNKTLIEKYKAKEQLSKNDWKTEEARQEMKKYENEMEKEYLRLADLEKDLEDLKKSLLIKSVIAIVALVFLFILESDFLGVIVLVGSVYIIYPNYKKYVESKNAREMHELVQKFLNKNDKKQDNSDLTNNNFNDVKNTKMCTRCGAKVEKGMKFCTQCGMQLNMSEDVNDTIKCPSCGAKVEKGMKFCTQCGTKLENQK